MTALEHAVFLKMIELHVQHERRDKMPSTNPRFVGDDDELEPDEDAEERAMRHEQARLFPGDEE
jgi:hypothetical protein